MLTLRGETWDTGGKFTDTELEAAGNCALGLVEATDKLGPGKQKLDEAAGGTAAGKDKAADLDVQS